MPSTLQQAMDRIAQLETDAVDGIVEANAVSYYPYDQERLPYWANQVQSVAFERGYGEDVEVRIYTILMRLVLAHRTENYDGVTFDTAYDIIPAVLDTFQSNRWLTTSAHADELDGVFSLDGYHGAEIAAVTGPVVFTNGGVPTQQVGMQFTLTLPLIEQRY